MPKGTEFLLIGAGPFIMAGLAAPMAHAEPTLIIAVHSREPQAPPPERPVQVIPLLSPAILSDPIIVISATPGIPRPRIEDSATNHPVRITTDTLIAYYRPP